MRAGKGKRDEEDEEGSDKRTPGSEHPSEAAVFDFLDDGYLEHGFLAEHDGEDRVDDKIEEDGQVDGGMMPVEGAFKSFGGRLVGFDASVGEDGLFMDHENSATTKDGIGKALVGRGDGRESRRGVGIGGVRIRVVGRIGHEDELSRGSVFGRQIVFELRERRSIKGGKRGFQA